MGRPRTYDRFMVDLKIGTNRKLRRAKPSERWIYVAGVLSLAAQSPVRGSLLLASGYPVTDRDIADEASVTLRLAKTAMARFRSLGLLERDEANDCELVHDFADWNPPPRSDSTAGERERKRRQRAQRKAA